MDGAAEGSPHERADVEVELVGTQVRLRVPGGEVLLTEAEATAVSSRLLEMAARAEGVDTEERDWKRITMQYLRMAVEEEIEAGDVPPRTGTIHCWIKNQTRTNALHVACGWINDDSWYVTELFEQRAVTKADFEDEAAQFYDQALIDDQVFVYEIDGDEEEEEGPSDGN